MEVSSHHSTMITGKLTAIPLLLAVSTNDECKLYCRVNKNTLYFLLKHKVKDGTPCNQDGFDKCVNGHCHQAGCDNILYSTAVLGECLDGLIN